MLHRTFWGLILIAVGVMFLLERLGLIHIDLGELIKTYWPVFIIIAGISGLISSARYGLGAGIWNLLVCGVGVIFLLHNLDITGLSIGELFAYMGPAALILFGIGLIFHSPSSRKRHRHDPHSRAFHSPKHQQQPDQSYYEIYGDKPPAPPPAPHTAEPPNGSWNEWGAKDAERTAEKMDKFARKMEKAAHRAAYKAHKAAAKSDYISTLAPGAGASHHKSGFIGDVFLGRDYWELQPMTISHFIGDTVIDLTKAEVPYGETKLVVSSFIGDVKMLVPADLDVEILVNASSFIGDMKVLDRHETGMMRSVQTQTRYYADGERKIKLIVSVFIGDVFVKKVG